MNYENLPTIELPSKAKNLTNTKQGKLTYIKPAENRNGRIYWWVQCECGEIEKIRNDNKKLQCNNCSKQNKSKNLKKKKMINLTNQKFGKLTALYPTEERKYGNIVWHCKCDCGNECDIKSSNLINGITQSCGCLKKKYAEKMGKNNLKDLTGQKFGFLKALKPTEKRSGSSVIWECLCDCGNIHHVPSSDLIRGSIKSCGCQQHNGEKNIIDIINKKFGKLTVIKRMDKNIDGSYNYLCKCDCGNEKIVNGCSLRTGDTTSCGCIKYSIGEKNILEILNNNNLSYIKEYSIKELGNKRFDFAILDTNNTPIRFIEFDGRQHYEKINSIWEKSASLEERQKRDNIKNKYCKDNNIPLVRIPYWKRDNITLDMIMGDKYLIK